MPIEIDVNIGLVFQFLVCLFVCLFFVAFSCLVQLVIGPETIQFKLSMAEKELHVKCALPFCLVYLPC